MSAASACGLGHDLGREVTAVITTHGRPHLVSRALRSVVAQTVPPVEIIVVIDGPDGQTAEAIDALSIDGLRVVSLPVRRGGGGARNAGIAIARAPWIALLDDDDEWLPEKLARQLELARSVDDHVPITACLTRYQTPTGTFIQPRRLPRPDEDVSEYLLTRRSLYKGEGMVQTSMILAPRQLFVDVPFREHLPRHQDLDWVIRANRLAGARLHFVPEMLSVWYAEEPRATITGSVDWRPSVAWADDVRDLLTRRSYAGFLLTFVASLASRAGDRRSAGLLLRKAMATGGVRPAELSLFVGLWTIPQGLRLGIRRLLHGRALPTRRT
jgi:glycosyltransferase involved in cell wall biosynthesis